MGAGASAADCDKFEHVMSGNDCYAAVNAQQIKEEQPQSNNPQKRLESAQKAGRPRPLSLEVPGGPEQEQEHPPALLPYLRSLFMARRKDPAQAAMPVHDFWDIVEALFAHVLSDFDNSRLEMFLDAKTDDPVTWNEANEYFTFQFNILKLRKKDCWVGLRTLSERGRYFWYNVADDTSFWMTEEESARFVRCMALPPSQRPSRHLMPCAGHVDTPHASAAKMKVVVASPRASPRARTPRSPFHGKSSRGAQAVLYH